jgi:undecaprenyl-diphosphatase
MDELRAIVIGLVQGLTEFLPISSSGHLIIVREMFHWHFLEDDLTFDVALHLGTTVAVLAYFWREWLQMATALLPGRQTSSAPAANPDSIYNSRFLMLLIAGSLPAAIVGVALGDWVENEVRSPLVVGAMLIVFGLVLLFAEQVGRKTRQIAGAGWGDALLVGCAQAVSLVPGVSRSGITITAALVRGFRREDAARFSFLLATPVIVGAGLFKMAEAARDGIPSSDVPVLLLGTVAASVVGWASIGYLLRLVQTQSYAPFIVYRVLAGMFFLIYFSLT